MTDICDLLNSKHQIAIGISRKALEMYLSPAAADKTTVQRAVFEYAMTQIARHRRSHHF